MMGFMAFMSEWWGLLPAWGDVLGWLLYALALVLFVAGVLGCVLPYPGTLLVLGGCVVWVWAGGGAGACPGAGLWALLGVLALLGCFTDSIFSLLGAKRFGCSRAAFWCSAVGLFVGAFFFPIGLILGPFLGAFLGELALARRGVDASARSGVGAVLGALAGMGAKFVIAGLILLLFFRCVW